MTPPKDKHGRTVDVGARVRVVELSPQFLASLPPEEIEDVRSMVGGVFEVYEIDEYGCAWVQKTWHYPQSGKSMSHSLSLKQHQMELVQENAF